MRSPKQWVAGFMWGANSGHGVIAGGSMAPRGTATLALQLTGSAGVHGGRSVDFVIPPKDLDDVIKFLEYARDIRDGATPSDRTYRPRWARPESNGGK